MQGAGPLQDNASHKHAVSSTSNGKSFGYDANGNMTTRTISGVTYTLTYDAENRLVSFSGGDITASFVYNGDGERVKGTVNGVTTTYIGNYLEYTGSTFTRYIYAGSQRIAMYQGATLYYLASDHLGSTSVTYNTSGGLVAAKRYMPWGEERYSSGSTPTTYLYSGQRWEASLGLSFFNARWYDSALGRFISADTIVPLASQGVQAWDRFAFVNNSPVMYTDPTGHDVCDEDGNCYRQGQHHKINGRNSINWWAMIYNITFSGKWEYRNQLAAITAIKNVGTAFSRVLDNGMNGWQAFRAVYGWMELAWVSSYTNNGNIYTSGAITKSGNRIEFASMSTETVSVGGYRTFSMAFTSARNNVVHELGHAFANLWWIDSDTYDQSGPYGAKFTIPGAYQNNEGFYLYPKPDSASLTWRQHPCTAGDNTCSHECFADQFLGWTYGRWAGNASGDWRANYMTTNMAEWVLAATQR